ncbi:MAG: minor capsid protein [Bacteroidales bacterium]|nr:minor capsid protein [Bacteroidales bacterium]
MKRAALKKGVNRLPELYRDACPCCGTNKHPQALDKLPKEYMDQYPDAIKDAIEKAYNGDTSYDLLKITAEALKKQVMDNYSKIVFKYEVEDTQMLSNLVNNVWQFSAAKNYVEMKQFTDLLKDKNGKLREFSDYKREVEKLGSKYNEIYMRTEYNFAIAASQNAARWTEFEKEVDIIPNLKYQTVRDDAVRYEHAILDGTVKPMKDDWWNRYYPPNGWGCRCEAVQCSDGTPVTKEAQTIGIPKMFETNLAKQGLIYPKNHPYFKDIPASELRKAILYLPAENTYTTLQIGDKFIDVHPLHGNHELQKNLEACEILLKHDPDAKLKLLPVINEKEKEVKNKFYPKAYVEKFKNKNADALCNGKVVEFKEPREGSGIENIIKKAKEQADIVILKVPDNVVWDGEEGIERNVFKRLGHYKGQDFEVWVMNNDELRKYTPKPKE